jgi:hypothetical protein
MGGTAAGRLTSTYYGSSAAVPAVSGGAQSDTASTTLAVGNVPQFTFTPSGTVASTASTNFAYGNIVSATSADYLYAVSNASSKNTGDPAGLAITSAFFGNAISIGSASPAAATSAAFGTVQPTLTVNYIIKVAPNTTGGGGVVSLGGMFGDILCGSGLICAAGTISANPSSSNITIGSTGVVSGTSGNVLIDNAGVLGQIAPSTTVNGTLCALGATCTVSAASALIVGSSTITSGTPGYLEYNAAGVLGERKLHS